VGWLPRRNECALRPGQEDVARPGPGHRQQYGINAITLLPVNLYGPGDSFDPARSHVIPALINKFAEAMLLGTDTVAVWGSRRATRGFLYVEDAAEGIVLATERYEGSEPVNLGSGMELSIRQLAELIAEIIGFDGRLRFDNSQPVGQPRRSLNTHRAEACFAFRARTPLREGLQKTIDWYLATRRQHAEALVARA
jgi:GDP-L-fucose synthase